MPAAARITDTTSHGTPLTPGPGSANVFVGRLSAWRALPSGVGAGLEAASQAMSTLMSAPTLTPVDATASLAQAQAGLTQSAAAAAASGNPAATSTTATALATLNATNASLTAAYITACAVPGGAAAAATAYTQAIKAAAAAAASAAVAAIAGTTDMHNCPLPCPTPPHGPGVVTRGSRSVFINKLPAVRMTDTVYEACGGADAIAAGSATVFIGDAGGPAAPGGSSAAALADAMASAVTDAVAEIRLVQAATVVAGQNRAAAENGSGLCEICEAAQADATAGAEDASHPSDAQRADPGS